MWNGEDLDDAAQDRIVVIYRLTVLDDNPVLDIELG
jgi:hypothetical protein